LRYRVPQTNPQGDFDQTIIHAAELAELISVTERIVSLRRQGMPKEHFIDLIPEQWHLVTLIRQMAKPNEQ
jgi:hypothetical protein